MLDGDGASGAGYAGGEENRCGDAVAARDGVSFGVGVAGKSEVVYVRGPVLCGLVDIGAGIETFFWGSLSPFVAGLGAISGGAISVGEF